MLSHKLNNCLLSLGGGGWYSLIWPTQGCAAGQGMVFVLSVLNRIYSLAQVCHTVINRVYNFLPV